MKMLQKPIPFNINGMRVIEYDLTPKAIPYSRSILETNIKNSMIDRNVDSLVHTLLPDLNVTQAISDRDYRSSGVWRRKPQRGEARDCDRRYHEGRFRRRLGQS
jgi:hypothetical protein